MTWQKEGSEWVLREKCRNLNRQERVKEGRKDTEHPKTFLSVVIQIMNVIEVWNIDQEHLTFYHGQPALKQRWYWSNILFEFYEQILYGLCF